MQRPMSKLFVSIKGFTVCKCRSQSYSLRFTVFPQYAKAEVKAIRFGLQYFRSVQRPKLKLFTLVYSISAVCKGRSQSYSFSFPYFHSMQRPKSKLFILVSIVPQYAKAKAKAIRFGFHSSIVCKGQSQSYSFQFPVVPQYAEAGVKAIRFSFPQLHSMQRPKSKLFISVSIVPQYAEAKVKAIHFGQVTALLYALHLSSCSLVLIIVVSLSLFEVGLLSPYIPKSIYKHTLSATHNLIHTHIRNHTIPHNIHIHPSFLNLPLK